MNFMDIIIYLYMYFDIDAIESDINDEGLI